MNTWTISNVNVIQCKVYHIKTQIHSSNRSIADKIHKYTSFSLSLFSIKLYKSKNYKGSLKFKSKQELKDQAMSTQYAVIAREVESLI